MPSSSPPSTASTQRLSLLGPYTNTKRAGAESGRSLSRYYSASSGDSAAAPSPPAAPVAPPLLCPAVAATTPGATGGTPALPSPAVAATASAAAAVTPLLLSLAVAVTPPLLSRDTPIETSAAAAVADGAGAAAAAVTPPLLSPDALTKNVTGAAAAGAATAAVTHPLLSPDTPTETAAAAADVTPPLLSPNFLAETVASAAAAVPSQTAPAPPCLTYLNTALGSGNVQCSAMGSAKAIVTRVRIGVRSVQSQKKQLDAPESKVKESLVEAAASFAAEPAATAAAVATTAAATIAVAAATGAAATFAAAATASAAAATAAATAAVATSKWHARLGDDVDLEELDPDLHANPKHRWDISTMMVKEPLASWKGKAVKAAMDEEIRSPIGIGTWELVERIPGVNIMKSRWVLTTKYRIDETVEREKARLVVKGFMQVYGADYNKTYMPVSSYFMLRIFLSIVAVLDLHLM
ncbi:unnamed protein product [Closterium sp. NIES-54]